MLESKNLIRGFLSIGLFVLIVAMLYSLVRHEIPEGSREVYGAVLGIVSGAFGTVVAFYFKDGMNEKNSDVDSRKPTKKEGEQ